MFGAAVGIPSGVPNGVASTTGTLSLNNTGDTVTLKNASSTAVDAVTYGSSLASTDAVSMNRSPDADHSGAFVPHTGLSPLSASPGTQAHGAAFP